MLHESIDINKCSREGFKACYYDAAGYGFFKGKVIKIKGNGPSIRYLFKNIYVEHQSGLNFIKSKEDHVWIANAVSLKDKGVKIGDCVSFAGKIEPYKRRNGTYDLGISKLEDVEVIDEYDLPSDEELMEQFANQLKCETCLFSEQCYGNFCIRE